jgi:hypothetical protein
MEFMSAGGTLLLAKNLGHNAAEALSSPPEKSIRQ